MVREGSVGKVPHGAIPVTGDALNTQSLISLLRPGETVIHLVGTPHPNPFKGRQFQQVDLASIRAMVIAAKKAAVSHLVYLSVAHPAPVMKRYLAVRMLGESMIRETGITATFMRPWYILGPGRTWPKLAIPFYRIAEAMPLTRPMAERLGLVTVEQMVCALVAAVEVPPAAGKQKVIDVPKIRAAVPTEPTE